MLKDVHVVVLSIQIVGYLGFLKREIGDISKTWRPSANLQDPYPGPQGNAQLLQSFLGKVGQLKHPDLRLLKDTRVLLVTKVLQE